MTKDKTRAYIICPVRHLEANEKDRIDAFVKTLEESNYIVRLPYSDTKQDMDSMSITEEHEQDILWADEIWVWWNPKSEGSLWDFAQARMAQRFMPDKYIFLINYGEFKETPEKSYQNVVLKTAT